MDISMDIVLSHLLIKLNYLSVLSLYNIFLSVVLTLFLVYLRHSVK